MLLPENERPFDVDRIPEPTHPTKSTKLANKFFAVALLTIAIAVGFFLYWSLQPTDVLEVKNSPFPARVEPDPSGRTGGTIYLKINYCKNTDLHGEVRTSFLSESREQFSPIVTEKIKRGCANTEFPVIIPTNLSEDVYIIKFRATYDVNPLKKNIDILFESQPVDISKSKVQ